MDIAHHSLPKGLTFSARIILGIAVVAGGAYLLLRVASSIEQVIVGLVLVGLAAGYIFKKHFFWAMLIPIGVTIALSMIYFEPADPFITRVSARVSAAGAVLYYYALPAYLGAFVGCLISVGIAEKKAHSQ